MADSARHILPRAVLTRTENQSLVVDVGLSRVLLLIPIAADGSWGSRTFPAISSLLELRELISYLEISCVKLALQMHRETLISIGGGLKCTANFANLHILIFVDNVIVHQSFQFRLLLFKFFNFPENGLSLLNFAVFSKFFSLLMINRNLLL